MVHFFKNVKIRHMSVRYFNVCKPLDYGEQAQIIHRISGSLYRIINFEFSLDRDPFVYDSDMIKVYTTGIIADLQLRQDGESVAIETISQTANNWIVQDIVAQFSERMQALSKLEQTMNQMQHVIYYVDICSPCGLNYTIFMNKLFNVTIYSGEREFAKGIMELSSKEITLTLCNQNKNLIGQEFATLFLQILERAKQVQIGDKFLGSIATKPINLRPIRVDDAVFEYCYRNREKIAILVRSVKSIDVDSDEIRIVGKPYAITDVARDHSNCRVTLVDKNMPVDMQVLAPYLL